MDTSDATERPESRSLWSRLRELPGNGLLSDRRVLVGSAAIVLTSAVIASVALASPSSTSAKTKPAADKVQTHKPAYLTPIGSLIASGTVPQPSLSGDSGKTGVPAGTAPAPTKPTTTDVGPRSQSIAGYQGGAGTITPSDIATLAIQRGCSPTQAVTATAIAMAESGGSPSAQGDIALMDATWDWSAGLWQIRGLRSERNTGELRDSIANQSAEKNATAMYMISNSCSSWTPWSTYNTGAYAQYMGIATQAAKYVVSYYNAHGHHFPPVAAPNPNATIPSQSASPGHTITSAPGSSTSTTGRHAPIKAKHGAKGKSTSAAGHPARSAGTTKPGSKAGRSAGNGGGGNGGGGNGGGSITGSGASSAKTAEPNPIKSIVSGVKSIIPKPTKPILPPVTSILPLPTITLPHIP